MLIFLLFQILGFVDFCSAAAQVSFSVTLHHYSKFLSKSTRRLQVKPNNVTATLEFLPPSAAIVWSVRQIGRGVRLTIMKNCLDAGLCSVNSPPVNRFNYI